MSKECFWDGHRSHRTNKCTEGWHIIYLLLGSTDPLDWCEKNINGKWCWDGFFYFENIDDLLLFKLVWT